MKSKFHNRKIIGISTFLLCFVAIITSVVIYVKASDKQVEYVEHTFSTVDAAIASVEEGYLYGGLYTIEEIDGETKYIGVKEPVEGETYQLKWVPEGLLSVEAQVSGTLLDADTSDDGSSTIRFATTIDDLQYRKLGFKIAFEGGNTIDAVEVSRYVHTKIYAVDQTTGEFIEYEPTDIHSAAKYFKTYSIKGVPQEYYDNDFTVTAYYVTMDGTRVEGTNTIGIKTVNLGRSWIYVIDPEKIATTDGVSDKNLGTENDPFQSLEAAAAYDVNERMNIILKSDMPVESRISFEDNDDDKITHVSITGYTEIPYIATSNSSKAYTLTRDTASAGMFLVGEDQELTITGNTTLDGNASSTSTASQAMIVNAGTLKVASSATLKNGYKSGTASYFGTGNSAGAIESNGTLYINGTVTNCGSGNYSAVSSLAGTITMDGAKLNDNAGRAIRIVSGTASIANAEFNNNDCSSSNGGAVLIDAGDVTITDTTLNTNTANVNGGAIHMNKTGTLALEGCTLDGNTVSATGNTFGGAISVASAERTLSLTDCTISNNTISTTNSGTSGSSAYGARGGALYLQGSGTIALEGCTISGNSATASTYGTNKHFGNGGGIYVYSTCTADISITDSNITGNTATSEGGGMYLGAGSANVTISRTLTDDTVTTGIHSNTAGRGAGIYTVSTGTLTVTGESITGNNTTSLSGYGTGAGVFSNCTGDQIFTECTVTSNTATANGGGMLFGASAKNVTFDTCNMTDNQATYGGAVCCFAGGTVTVAGGTYTENTTTSLGGGALYFSDDTAAISISDAEFTKNVAAGGGGAIRINNATGTIDNCTITGNTAGGGGGLVFESANITMTGGTKVSGNVSNSAGGGVMTVSEATLSISGSCEITNNVAANNGGGLMIGPYEADGTATPMTVDVDVTDCVITGNALTSLNEEVSGCGAGVYVNANGTLDLTNCTIDSNVATPYDTSYSDISKATGNGGGLFINNAGTVVTTITGGSISSNSGQRGAGVFVDGNTAGTSLTMSGVTVNGNTGSGSGGALCLVGTSNTTVLSECELSNNIINAPALSYTGCGAGIYANCAGTLNMTNCKVDGNTANDNADYYTYPTEGNGGGIYLQTDCTIALTMTGTESSVSNNTACIGGGLYIANNATHSITGCTISGNQTQKRLDTANASDNTNYANKIGYAGGIMIRREAIVTLDSCTISNNKGLAGGGIVLMGGDTNTLTMTGCTLSGNSATGKNGGGAMFLNKKSATVDMTSCSFDSNTAASGLRGGAIRMEQGTLNASSCTFTGNSAGTSGGALFLNTYRTTSYYGYGCEDGSATDLKTAAETYTYYSVVTLTGCTFTDNLVNGSTTGTSSNQGSAIHNKCNLTLTGTNTFNSTVINSATLWSANSPAWVYNESPGSTVDATTYPCGVTYN